MNISLTIPARGINNTSYNHLLAKPTNQKTAESIKYSYCNKNHPRKTTKIQHTTCKNQLPKQNKKHSKIRQQNKNLFSSYLQLKIEQQNNKIENKKLYNQYSNNGVGLNFLVVGSTANPSDSKITTPSKTLSILFEIKTGVMSSLLSMDILASPFFKVMMPAPVSTFASVIGLIPSLDANSSGNTDKVAPVSTRAFTLVECFLARSDILTSTNVCPILYHNESDLINVAEGISEGFCDELVLEKSYKLEGDYVLDSGNLCLGSLENNANKDINKNQNEFFDFKNSANSFVLNILTRDCSFNLLSLDHIGQLYFNANAKYCVSSGSGVMDSASSLNSLYSETATNSTNHVSIVLYNSKTPISILDLDIISSKYSFNSSNAYFGENNSKSELVNNFLVKECFLKKENNIFISTTNFIISSKDSLNYDVSFKNLLCIDSFASLPSLMQSSSVNSEFSSILSNFLSIDCLLTFSNKNSLVISDQFISGNLSIFFFKSSDINNVIFGILSPQIFVYVVGDVELFKVFVLDVKDIFVMSKILGKNSGKKPCKLEMNHVLETGNLGLGNWKEVRQEKEVFVCNEI